MPSDPTSTQPAARPSYGVDGFPYVVGLSVAAVVFLAAGLIGLSVAVGFGRALAGVAVLLGIAAAVPAALGIRYVTVGKFTLRDTLLSTITWTGQEAVADLGSGAGLLGIGAATRTSGTVHCIDLFIGKDLSGNTAQRLIRNAELAGVAARIDVRIEDVSAMTLPDNSVDVVLSALCLHNILDSQKRHAALVEIDRILRPGGRVAISDLAHVEDEYAPQLQALGFTIDPVARAADTFPPQRILTARKP